MSAPKYLWLRDIAPSTELCNWFIHDPAEWEEFQHRYHTELERSPEQLALPLQAFRKGPVTLLYAAKDELRNKAVALQQLLKR
jgi:uncharacterized protein YeaO (DUF488 family)